MSVVGRDRSDGRVGTLLRDLDDGEPRRVNKRVRHKRPSTRGLVCGTQIPAPYSSDDSQEEMCGALGALTLSATSWKSEEASAFSDVMNRYDGQVTTETGSLAYSDSDADELGGSDRLSVKEMVAQIEHHDPTDQNLGKHSGKEKNSHEHHDEQPADSAYHRSDSKMKISAPQHYQQTDANEDIPDSFEQMLSDCRSMAEESYLIKTNAPIQSHTPKEQRHSTRHQEDALSPSSSVFSNTIDFFRIKDKSKRSSVGSAAPSSIFSSKAINSNLVQDIELRNMLAKTHNGNDVSDFFPSMAREGWTSSFSDDGMDAELGALTSINDELRREIQKFETKAYLKSSSLSELMEEDRPKKEPIEIIQVESSPINRINLTGKEGTVPTGIGASVVPQPKSTQRNTEENSLGTFSTYATTEQSSETQIIHVDDGPLFSRTSVGSIDENELARMIADEDVQAVDLIRQALRYELSEMVQNQVYFKHQRDTNGANKHSDSSSRDLAGVLNEEQLAAMAANTEVPAKDVIREVLRKELAVVIHDEIQKQHDIISMVDPEGSTAKEKDEYYDEKSFPINKKLYHVGDRGVLQEQHGAQRDNTGNISQGKPLQKSNEGDEIEIIHIVESMSEDHVQQKYGEGRIKTQASNSPDQQKRKIPINGSIPRPMTGVDLTQPRRQSLAKPPQRTTAINSDFPSIDLGPYGADHNFQLSSLTDIPSIDTESSWSQSDQRLRNLQKQADESSILKGGSNGAGKTRIQTLSDRTQTEILLDEAYSHCKKKNHSVTPESEKLLTETGNCCASHLNEQRQEGLETKQSSRSVSSEKAQQNRKVDLPSSGEKRLVQVSKFLSFEKQIESDSVNDNAGVDATPKVKNTRCHEGQDFHEGHQQVSCVESKESIESIVDQSGKEQKIEAPHSAMPSMGNLSSLMKNSFASGNSGSSKKKSSIIQRIMHLDKSPQRSNSREQEGASVPNVVVGKLMQLTNYVIVENETDITDLTGSSSGESVHTDAQNFGEEGKHVRFSESTQFDTESTNNDQEKRWTLEDVYGKLEDAFDTFAFSCGQKIRKGPNATNAFEEAEEPYQPYHTNHACFPSHCGSRRESQASSITLEDEAIYSMKVPSKKH